MAYVDFEPVAVAHADKIVADLDTVSATRADLPGRARANFTRQLSRAA